MITIDAMFYFVQQLGLHGYVSVIHSKDDPRALAMAENAHIKALATFGSGSMDTSFGGKAVRHARYHDVMNAQVRFILVALTSSDWETLFQEDCDTLLVQETPIWVGFGSNIRASRCNSSSTLSTSSWFTSVVNWNMSTDILANRAFLNTYKNATGKIFNNMDESADLAIASFNSVISVASAINHILNLNIYQNNPIYAASVLDALLKVNISGAGGPVEFDNNLNLKPASSSIMRIKEDDDDDDDDTRRSGLVHVGTFVPGENHTIDRTAAFPSTYAVPLNPIPHSCEPGYRQINEFKCEPCGKGEYAASLKSPKCSLCHRGDYQDNSVAARCTHCPEGATTWLSGTKEKVACRCKANFFAANLDTVQLLFLSEGCYMRPTTGLTFAGDLSVLGDCNWKCLELQKNEPEKSFTYFLAEDDMCFCASTNQVETMNTANHACIEGCPKDGNQICGAKHHVSAYVIVDTLQISTPCLPCPTTQTAIAHELSATCAGGMVPPIARQGYWSPLTFPIEKRAFFKCPGGIDACAGGQVYGTDLNPPTGTTVLLASCHEGYESTMCAGCTKDHYKDFPLKKCTKCPPIAIGWMWYIPMPILMIGFWFPGLLWVYRKLPSFFFTFTYLQMSAIIGLFDFSSTASLDTALSLAGMVNFDVNLFMFDCSLNQPGFLFKWLVLQLLPLYFWCTYLGKYYYNLAYQNPNPDSNKPEHGSRLEAIKLSLAISNCLYLPVAGEALALYSCHLLPDGSSYLAAYPEVICYEGGHLAAVLLSVIQFILFIFGWPLMLFVVFYIGNRRQLLYQPAFRNLFSWLYARYEVEYFWWHTVIILQKFSLVTIKVFLKGSFFQAPVAFLGLLGLLAAQMFARPCYDTNFDMMQSCICFAQVCYIFLVVLLNTSLGATPGEKGYNQVLNSAFLTLFSVVTSGCFYMMYLDILKRAAYRKVNEFVAEKGLKLKSTNYKIHRLKKWIDTDPAQIDLEFCNMATYWIGRRYDLPQHLMIPYQELVTSYPEIFVWLLDDAPPLEQGAPMGATIAYFLDNHNKTLNETAEDTAVSSWGTDDSVFGKAGPWRMLTWIRRDISQKLEEEDESSFTKDNNPMQKLFTIECRARTLHGLLHCSHKERHLKTLP